MSYILNRMTSADAPLTVEWMVRQYGFSKHEVEEWVANLHFNWPLSVKAEEKGSGRVLGLLNMSDYRIEEETHPHCQRTTPTTCATQRTALHRRVFVHRGSAISRHTAQLRHADEHHARTESQLRFCVCACASPT